MTGQGPLAGVRVLEFAGIGPGPFCVMMLSDLGAEVLRVDRKGAPGAMPTEVPARGRKSIALDLKDPAAVELCLKAVEKADVVLEGYRPGVMERLGLGPDVALGRNPRLVYARMTGWGQDGPLAHAAGHDLNYIALTGALSATGDKHGRPVPALNLVGDFGGGAAYLAFGIAAALFEAQRSGRGQVIDGAVVDGTASMMAQWSWFEAQGLGRARRGENFLDGSAFWYRTYQCADGEYVSIGSFEPQFYAQLLDKLGLRPEDLPAQFDLAAWEQAGRKLEAIFRTRTRDEWCALMEGTDVCFAPVLHLSEAPEHPHLKARETFVEAYGVVQPAPAPRFSRTPGAIQGPPPAAGEGGAELLGTWGVQV
ncbi:MAG TPA: CaiB/BaiF CoA-transferase family protein [Caulobacteraceae bacterium]|nr:CaiB/BaiF CoA-transferase family protein [Caulobacteraceae bacterium]